MSKKFHGFKRTKNLCILTGYAGYSWAVVKSCLKIPLIWANQVVNKIKAKKTSIMYDKIKTRSDMLQGQALFRAWTFREDSL